MAPRNVVLIHGWGLNRGIWRDYVAHVSAEHPELSFHCLDIPGYGKRHSQPSSSKLTELAQSCLSQAPEEAVWVGWSLGGMIALEAARLDQLRLDQLSLDQRSGHGSRRIQALQLINTTAKFVSSVDWQHGLENEALYRLGSALTDDYEASLRSFLLLQAGTTAGAREVAKIAAESISDFPSPLKSTLKQGLKCLIQTDLRPLIKPAAIRSQVVCGVLDRVTNPVGTRALADMLKAELVAINAGHAPFLTDPRATMEALIRLLGLTTIRELAPCN